MQVDIIGAGVAGLCLGIRLQRRGVGTVIYEAGARAGGLCTNWQRGGYDFNGCLHWVLGARSGSSFYDMWRTVVDIDSLRFVDFDERVDIEVPEDDGSTWHFHLYNDVDRFESYMLSLAPEDEEAIRGWADAVRTVMRFLPNLPPFPTEPTAFGRAWHYVGLWRMWRMLPLMRKWGRLTTRSFADTLRNERLCNAVRRLYMDEVRMTVVIFGQAYMASRVAAYPLGGSAALTDLLVRTYESLGGRIEYRARVGKIRVENNKAVGLTLADGRETVADAVCSCADWRWTVGSALGGRYLSAAQALLLDAPKERFFYSYVRAHIGIAQDLSYLPHFCRLAVDLTLPDGRHFDQMEVEINHFDTALAPQGKTTISVNFTTREGQWWINLRERDHSAYLDAKMRFIKMVVTTLTDKFKGEIDHAKIEVVDVATPATYHRYTLNALGSSQGWSPQDDLMKRLPVGPTLSGLSHFAMAGHWMEAGGGLPIALYSALKAEKIITRQIGK